MWHHKDSFEFVNRRWSCTSPLFGSGIRKSCSAWGNQKSISLICLISTLYNLIVIAQIRSWFKEQLLSAPKATLIPKRSHTRISNQKKTRSFNKFNRCCNQYICYWTLNWSCSNRAMHKMYRRPIRFVFDRIRRITLDKCSFGREGHGRLKEEHKFSPKLSFSPQFGPIDHS